MTDHPSLQQPDFDWGRFRYCPDCDLPSFDVAIGECSMCAPSDPVPGVALVLVAGLAFWAVVIWSVTRLVTR